MLKKIIVIAVLAAASQLASAAVLTEAFEADFPTWESGWFATNSNAQNYYGVGQGRGNNPDGLWIDDNSPTDEDIRIVFNNAFALSLTSFSLDVAGYADGTRLQFFDANGAVLSDSLITLTYGAFTDPGTYVNYGVTSGTGIGGFEFYDSSPEGNTSIDNLVAATNGDGQAVPEPATWVMMLPMLSLVALYNRRMRRTAPKL